jgi:hypothetical protein
MPMTFHFQYNMDEAKQHRQKKRVRVDVHGEDSHETEADPSDEVLEYYNLAECPAADTFYDESIARWPAMTCSELGAKRIRLIKIMPGPPCSTIRCRVSRCFLDQAPSYTAVSYTWGSPLGFREILIDGQPRSVTKNIWRFLDQARRLHSSNRLTGWLWIDALSIDQLDPREKQQQVGILSSIFKTAERVVVWLGPAYKNSDRALAALRPNSTKRPRRDSRTLAGPMWSAVHGLCERPYWRRLWVYQELKFAASVELMCGNKLLPIRDFQDYFSSAATNRSEDEFEILRKSSAGMMLSLVKDPSELGILSLIRKTQHLCCADKRDKAYAILDVARIPDPKIEADYTITIPVLLNCILEATLETEPVVYYGLKGERREVEKTPDMYDVVDRCVELEKLFGEPLTSMFVTKDPLDFSRHIDPYGVCRYEGHSEDLKLGELLSKWSEFYSHKSIQKLVSEFRFGGPARIVHPWYEYPQWTEEWV